MPTPTPTGDATLGLQKIAEIANQRYFTKLASAGIVPENEQEAQTLLTLGDACAQALAEAPPTDRFAAALGKQAADDDATFLSQASVLLEDPDIGEAVADHLRTHADAPTA